jgi:hypothetical protein
MIHVFLCIFSIGFIWWLVLSDIRKQNREFRERQKILYMLSKYGTGIFAGVIFTGSTSQQYKSIVGEEDG